MADKRSWKQGLSSALADYLSCLMALACQPFMLACGLRKAGFRKVKGQWAWVGHSAAVGRWESILNVDSDSFVILKDARYAKDDEHVLLGLITTRSTQPMVSAA